MGRLTKGQLEVLNLLAQGYTREEAAAELEIDPMALKSRLREASVKYRLPRVRTIQLVKLAIRDGEIKTPARKSQQNFTNQEKYILALIFQGVDVTAIAPLVGLPLRTLRRRVIDLYEKLGANNKTHAVYLGHCYGLLR